MLTPSGCHIVSLEVKPFFTNVPLEHIIELVLERIYNKEELVNNFTRMEVKEMLLQYTKNIHFSYNQDIYILRDDVPWALLWP